MKKLSESFEEEKEQKKLTAKEMEEFLEWNKATKKQRFAKITDMA